jgi:hypothetical protein
LSGVARRLASGRAQRGAALIVFATVLILSVAWFTVGALGKAAPSQASRDIRTGEALQAAKRALLGYTAQYAARTNHDKPGRLPCPESLNSIGTANEGEAPGSCSNTTTEVGRLPWKTLGVDRLVDGAGEPLWYVLSPGFRGVTPATAINFDTPGQLTLDGSPNAAVALIIAPGAALDTQLDADTPPAGCAKRNQGGSRGTAPLDALDFVECGNATGSYVTAGTSKWLNDRVLAVTAAEWADAIAGSVADRLQRQVAPALEDWRATQSVTSWGTSFLPNASTFATSAPATNDLCGDLNVIEGMPPSATVASAACSTAWSGGAAGGLGFLLSFGGCAQTGAELQCDFTVLLGGLISPTITATAPRVAHSLRNFNAAQITYEVNGGAPQGGSASGYAASLSVVDGSASITFQVNLPLLSIADNVVVRIPNPTDALLADTRTQWFVNNNWDRFTYYAVSRAATVNPAGSVCATAGDVDCMTVNGMPAPANDKRLVLALAGRNLAAQSRPSTLVADYLEAGNASAADRVFDATTVSSLFNDRIAACPFQVTPSGGPVTICN